VGKALVETSAGETIKSAGARLAAAALISFVLLCALNAASLLTLHNALVAPFKRLQSFAHKITTGKFDEPLPLDENNAFGLFTQSFDVMRTSLYEAQQNQLKAERSKKELVASLSHDIKTPVTSIRLIAELLQVGNADPAAAAKLKTIETKADQIDRLMNNMLHSALEELGELKVNPSTVESGALHDIIKDADHFSKIRIGGIPDCLIELDAMRMEQVIGNIIANSYKYADTRIDVDFGIIGDFLRIDVNDYGGGVEPEELELITTKFYRGENAKTSLKGGEGLGLYIARQLMVKMGGGLEAFNRRDGIGGLRHGFTVRLLLRLSV
jgi:signal transduction histidine kinase